MASSRLERIGTILTRKQAKNKLLDSITSIMSDLDADYTVMKDNEQKLKNLTGAFIKNIQQSTIASKQSITALREAHSSYKKEVEGLLTRGAMNPDDRPLWFDVYRAFPPVAEPKFARPKPEIKPIKQILYQEDITRAKLHSSGHGLGAVNMLINQSGETHTKRLLKQYEKLKAEGIPEAELIEKTIALTESARKEFVKPIKASQKTTESVTSNVLGGADLKNIFNDK